MAGEGERRGGEREAWKKKKLGFDSKGEYKRFQWWDGARQRELRAGRLLLFLRDGATAGESETEVKRNGAKRKVKRRGNQ